MNMKKTIMIILAGLLIISIAGCNNKKPSNPLAETSESLYVRQIDLPDNFIMGADISSVLALESSGVKYYGWDGEEQDIFRTLAESGVNTIRVRVWNDPKDSQGRGYGGGNCDIDNAVEIGKRATKQGLSLIVDFHYSDFWADPGKQMVPKAWKSLSIDEKAEALYSFTADSLKLLKKNGVNVSMVTLGNETNGAMCGENSWMNILKLMISGSRAVREVFPKAKIAVHFANPENNNYDNYASKLEYYGLDYDVFSTSYYPYWHGTLENLISEMNVITDKYGKEVMVMETSYAYTGEDSDFSGNTISDGSAVVKNYPYTVQGQANCVADIIEAVSRMEKGIGVCYWEPAWITVGHVSYEENLKIWEQYGSGWAASYARQYDPQDAGKYYGGSAVDNQALFDAYGHPLESLKLFNLIRKGNEIPTVVEEIADSYVSCDLNGEISLPEKVFAVMSDNSRREIDVVWNDLDEEKLRNGGANTYLIEGRAKGRRAVCYLSMIEFNYLKNYSFEDGDDSSWQFIDHGKADELYIEEKKTDSLTGSFHAHFWSAGRNTVNFDLKQTLTDLPQGIYKFTISIMGSDGGNTNIYSYVMINGKTVATCPSAITFYNSWDSPLIEGISVCEGDEVTVGIHVECSGEGNGAWGKIDDGLLNRQK